MRSDRGHRPPHPDQPRPRPPHSDPPHPDPSTAGPHPPRADEVAHGIARLEAHLLRHTEHRNAHADAQSFADDLPWLTPPQRAQLVALYVQERKLLARRTGDLIQDAVDQALTRYAAERRRPHGVTVALCLCVTALACALLHCHAG